MVYFKFISVFILSSIVLSASADEMIHDSLTNQSQMIEEVFVLGHTQKQTTSALPIQIVTSKQILMLNAINVSDLTKHLAGVNVKDYGGIGGMKTVSVRGLGAQYTGVCYDGMVMSDIQTGQMDLGRFCTENIAFLTLNTPQPNDIFQSARVFSSGAALMINTKINDCRVPKEVEGNVDFKTGSFGMYNPTGYFSFKPSNKTIANITVDYLTANGEYPFVITYGKKGSRTEVLSRINSDIEHLRTEANIKYNFTPRAELVSKVNFYTSERGIPGSVTYYNPYSTARMQDENLFAQLLYKNQNIKKLHHQVALKYNKAFNHFTEKDPVYASGLIDESYLQKEYYLSGSGMYLINKNLFLSSAIDWWYNSLLIESNSPFFKNFPYPTRKTTMGNIALKYITEKISATGNLLYTGTEETVKSGDVAPNKNKLSPTLSLSFKLSDVNDFRVRAFYKNIFRLPTFNDLYYQQLGNTNLLPENSNQYNVGLTFYKNYNGIFKELMITTDVYYYDITNKIIAIPRGVSWTMINRGKVDIKGLDVNTQSSFQLNKNSELSLLANYTFNLALDVTNEPNITNPNYGEQIPYTPLHSGSASIQYTWKKLQCACNLLYTGKRWSGQNVVSNRLAPHVITSLSSSYALKKIKLSAEIINLFNTQYEIIKYYPMPGINYRIGLNYSF